MSARSPQQVHPEHDRPTPQNLDDWTDEQLDEFNRLKEQDLADDLEEHARESAAARDAALDQLAGLVDDDQATATVSLGETEVTVREKLTGELEDNLDEISKLQDEQRPGVIGDSRDLLIDTILLLIVDDDEEGPYTLQDRETWMAFYREHGSEGLASAFEALVEPALERREDLKKFRDERPGARRT